MTKDNFIMLPTVDFCFRELMQNAKVRKGFIAALLKVRPEDIIQILELKKLPAEVKTGVDIIAWMKFFSGKNREEFERMAKTNEYLDEAYQTLLDLSTDEQKRLEYEAREKALKDYNT